MPSCPRKGLRPSFHRPPTIDLGRPGSGGASQDGATVLTVGVTSRRSTWFALGLLALQAPCSAATSTATFAPAAFGTVALLSSDLFNRQSICAFGSLLTQGYSVLATGSGAGGAFTIASGSATIPYELQWAQTGGATSGTNVVANVSLPNQAESGILAGVGCAVGVTTATSIVIVRSSSLLQATAGSYSGTLTIILTTQ